MKSSLFVLTFALLWLLDVFRIPAYGQNPLERELATLLETRSNTILFRQQNRQLDIQFVNGLYFKFDSMKLRLIALEPVQDELGLSKQQKEAVSELKKQIEEKNDNLSDKYSALNVDLEKKRYLDDAEKFSGDVLRKIDQILLPFQEKRLEQFEHRGFLIGRGLPATLADKTYREQFPKHQNRLPQVLKPVYTKLQDELANQFADHLSKIHELLNDEQRLALKKLVPDSQTSPPIEVLIWQLAPENVEREASFTDSFDEINVGRALRIKPDGALVEHNIQFMADPAGTLIADLRHNNTSLTLSENQQNDINELSSEDRNVLADFDKKQSEIQGQIAAGKMTLANAREEMNELLRELVDWKWKRFESILLPHQIAELDFVLMRRAINQRGIVASLSTGMTADALSISSAQLRKLKKLAKHDREKLINLSIECENEITETVNELFGDKSYSNLFGSRLKTLPGCPSFILRGLSGLAH